MIYLTKVLSEQIIKHARRELPNEACGILAGKNKSVEKVYEMTNVEKTPATYFMEAKEQLEVMKEIRNLDLEMVGIYHSHVASPAYPSRHDLELAFYSEASYVIISLQDQKTPKIRSFRIREGKIDEEELKIVDRSRHQSQI